MRWGRGVKYLSLTLTVPSKTWGFSSPPKSGDISTSISIFQRLHYVKDNVNRRRIFLPDHVEIMNPCHVFPLYFPDKFCKQLISVKICIFCGILITLTVRVRDRQCKAFQNMEFHLSSQEEGRTSRKHLNLNLRTLSPLCGRQCQQKNNFPTWSSFKIMNTRHVFPFISIYVKVFFGSYLVTWHTSMCVWKDSYANYERFQKHLIIELAINLLLSWTTFIYCYLITI